MDTNAVDLLRRLLAVKDPNVLGGIKHDLAGFIPFSPSDFEDLEKRIKGATVFDPSHPSIC